MNTNGTVQEAWSEYQLYMIYTGSTCLSCATVIVVCLICWLPFIGICALLYRAVFLI